MTHAPAGSRRTLLAATDHSEQGDHAVAVARLLAARMGGECAVATVTNGALPAEPASKPCTCGCDGSRGGIELHGIPGVELPRYAERRRAELLVLGRRDRSAEHPLALGETTDAVLRRGRGVTLLVPTQIAALKRVLIALDGTPRGLGVLGPATSLVGGLGAKASAILVLPESTDLVDDSSWPDPRRELVRQAIALKSGNGCPCPLEVRRGDPVREIFAAIADAGADLLVLGVRGGGAPGDLGSGHVGRDVLRAAPCAILTVPI